MPGPDKPDAAPNSGAKFFLHEHGVDPASGVHADYKQRPHVAESEVLVQANGGFVDAIADDGDHLAPGPLFAMFDQAGEQHTPAAAADMRRINVYRVFHGKS